MEKSRTSVHDNHLVAYTVFSEERKIVIQTVYLHKVPSEFTDVIFEDVLAYRFEHDLFGNIIFDVCEMDLAVLTDTHAAEFEAGWWHGWPWGWEKNKESVLSYFQRLEVKAFELSSSYGMTGWVVAKQMTKAARNPADETRP